MTHPAPLPPSGRQFVIRSGDAAAVAVEVGGGLRSFRVGDVDVLDGYAEDERASAGRGQVLAPWPNRLADGRWTYRGEPQQLPISEPATNTASHGLARWLTWSPVEQAADAVTLQVTVQPQPGWPGRVTLRTAYRLRGPELTVTLSARNDSAAPLPVGLGMHPYLAAGGPVDDCLLDLPVTVRAETDDRGLPTGRVPAEPRHGWRIGDTQLDTPFTGLRREPDGWAHVRLARPDGRTVVLSVDGAWRWLMVYTGDKAGPGRARRGLAVEPMTCPPNALASGEDLAELVPGATLAGSWRIGLAGL